MTFEEIATYIGTAIGAAGGTWALFKKFGVGQISTTNNRSYLEMVDYLEKMKNSAMEEKEKAERLLKETQLEAMEMRSKMLQLEQSNKDYRVQNKILSDIANSLQETLQRTKASIDEQLSINRELMTRLAQLEANHPHQPQRPSEGPR